MNTTAIRAFIAVEIDETTKLKLTELLVKLQKSECDVKWVKPENFHLTLVFLGDIVPEMIEPVKEALQNAVISFKPFHVEIRGTGFFGRPGRPRVIWVGVEPTDMIQQLYTAIRNELLSLKLVIEDRQYIPHLTIGRVRSTRGIEKLNQSLKSAEEHYFGTCILDSIVLMKSMLQSDGPVYSVLHRIYFAKK